jgi:hypothetical protein
MEMRCLMQQIIVLTITIQTRKTPILLVGTKLEMPVTAKVTLTVMAM